MVASENSNSNGDLLKNMFLCRFSFRIMQRRKIISHWPPCMRVYVGVYGCMWFFFVFFFVGGTFKGHNTQPLGVKMARISGSSQLMSLKLRNFGYPDNGTRLLNLLTELNNLKLGHQKTLGINYQLLNTEGVPRWNNDEPTERKEQKSNGARGQTRIGSKQT